jgi:hypothetical protein
MSVNEESNSSGEPIRCQLFVNLGNPWPGGGSLRNPILVIDVGKDAIRVVDPNTNALIASACLAQVTATPENYTYVDPGVGGGDGGTSGSRSCTMPVLAVGVPGLQPLTIQPREASRSSLTGSQSRFSWRGKVPGVFDNYEWARARRPAYTVTDAEWLALVEKFSLGALVVDEPRGGVRIELVIVLAFVALTLVLVLWTTIH